MNDDGRRVPFLRDGQVHVIDTAGLTDRGLTDDAAGITEATISGDGKIVYAVTGRGRLLKINVDNGAQLELIGRTPYLESAVGNLAPGFAAVLCGSGLSDFVIDGLPPLTPYLGNVTMWIGERKVPIVQLTPNSVRILIPWDIQPVNGSLRILAEAPGDHTPFGFPALQVPFTAVTSRPIAGALARQNWERTFVGPVNTGEIIHVLALGLGPVSPEPADGAAASSAEPLARITSPFTCSNAEILYAGLAPGAVERVYQIDLRIGPTPGYQQFKCSLAGSEPFIFLTLLVE